MEKTQAASGSSGGHAGVHGARAKPAGAASNAAAAGSAADGVQDFFALLSAQDPLAADGGADAFTAQDKFATADLTTAVPADPLVPAWLPAVPQPPAAPTAADGSSATAAANAASGGTDAVLSTGTGAAWDALAALGGKTPSVETAVPTEAATPAGAPDSVAGYGGILAQIQQTLAQQPADATQVSAAHPFAPAGAGQAGLLRGAKTAVGGVGGSATGAVPAVSSAAAAAQAAAGGRADAAPVADPTATAALQATLAPLAAAMTAPEGLREAEGGARRGDPADGQGGVSHVPAVGGTSLVDGGGYASLAPAGAAGAASAHVDVSGTHGGEVIAEQVSYWIGQDQQNAELVLDPFGHKVEVSIALTGNEAHVAFRSDQAQTRDLLDSSSGHLRDLLKAEGLVLSGVTVDTPGADTAAAQAGGRGAQGDGGRREGGRTARVATVASVGEGGGAVRPRAVATDRALDVFA